jgi:protein gp37
MNKQGDPSKGTAGIEWTHVFGVGTGRTWNPIGGCKHGCEWAVIGAASRGKQKFQPERQHVEHLLDWLDDAEIPTFFKGNLDWSPRREEFPQINPVSETRIETG